MKNATSYSALLVALVLWGCSSDDNDRPADTTAPTVSISTTGATVSRTVPLTATATDDRGVTQVEFLVDGSAIGTDTSTPFTVDWNTGAVADGTYSITARATDAAGNGTTSAAVAFTVQNNRTLNVVLAGSEEIPATLSLGAGTATLDVNLGSGAVSGSLVLTGLTASAAHIHEGFAGVNGPVVVGLVENATTPGTWELPTGSALTATQVDALLAGGLYVNAHSAAFPAGEIRGQIVPEGITVAFANLSGLQEVPAVDTTAAGQGAVTVNRAAGLATIHVTTLDVTDPTGAHLHEAPGGRNGDVVIPLTQDGSNPTHWAAVDQPISAAALTALDAGGTYLNVHTSAHPEGEIRGQVTPPGVLFVAGRLSGEQEVPVRSTTGKGTVAVSVDRTTRALVLHANATGVDDATAAHIHEAYAGANGGVIVPLTKDTADVTHWSATGVQLSEAQYAALLRGELYVNVHTPANPGGEIRGQLIPPGVQLVRTEMSGAQEVPPVTTNAVGLAATTVDLVGGTVSIHVRATGVDDATMAHIHKAARGTNGSVIVPLTEDLEDPGHWFAEDASVTTAQLQDFLGALWYVNVHTPDHGGGEIRGQIEPELPPAPDTTPPTVSLAALPATVSGTVELSATASDDAGVASVRFLVNGAEIATISAAPFVTPWNTTSVANGAVTVQAEALDAAGNVGQSGVLNVTVSNAAATTLSELQTTIFSPVCSGCHNGSGGGLPGSMNLSSAAATHAALVGVPSVGRPAVMRVAPGDAAASYLVRKLEGGPDIEGSRMPQGGPFLTTAQIDKVKSWINAGAQNN